MAWDLACLAETRRLDPAPALAAYGALPPPEVLADFRTLRRLHVTAWSFVFASRFPHLRAYARSRLSEWSVPGAR